MVCAAKLDHLPREGEAGPGPSTQTTQESRSGSSSPTARQPSRRSSMGGAGSDESIRGGRQSAKPGAMRNLYGALHVAGVKAPGLDGRQALWFLFTVRGGVVDDSGLMDLGFISAIRRLVSGWEIRSTGSSLRQRYCLRFRCYDITAVDGVRGGPSPILAEVLSQTFRVYSPRK